MSFGHSEDLEKLQKYCQLQPLFITIVKLLFQDLLNHYQMAMILMCEIALRFKNKSHKEVTDK